MRVPFALVLVAPFAFAAEPVHPAGVIRATEVEASPKMAASGIVWWNDRLIIAARGENKLLAFTPPDKFETLREASTPVGLAVDGEGNLIVVERGETAKILKITKDGKMTEIASKDVGSPHFITAHPKSRIYWSGFPDGGTRMILPGGEVEQLKPKIGHTYGIALNPKKDALFVASKLPDANRKAVYRFPLDDKGVPGEGVMFFKTQDLIPEFKDLPEAKDGGKSLLGWIGRLQALAIDDLGNFYIGGAEAHTSGEAVAVIDGTGKKVRSMILGVPRNVTSVAFGGKDGKTLFIVGSGEYKLHMARPFDPPAK